jgi:hypothetical protein
MILVTLTIKGINLLRAASEAMVNFPCRRFMLEELKTLKRQIYPDS